MFSISKQWKMVNEQKKAMRMENLWTRWRRGTAMATMYAHKIRSKQRKIWNEIKIHSNTNDGHLSAAKYHTTGETIIQTWIACRVLSVSFNRNIYLANGWAISCLHENGAWKNHWTSSQRDKMNGEYSILRGKMNNVHKMLRSQ